jgi:hypothetical protein
MVFIYVKVQLAPYIYQRLFKDELTCNKNGYVGPRGGAVG